VTPPPEPRELIDAPDRATWRGWLAQHHAEATGAWLIIHKKGSSRPGVTYAEAVEEGLCFGWIDSRANRLDKDRYALRFTPRKPRSVWAKSNKERVERLEAQGLMTLAGRALIQAAKADGSWDVLDGVEDLTMPDDLTAALAAEPAAERYFATFPPSTKKMILSWIGSAKRPETRAKRLAETVRMAAENRRTIAASGSRAGR
jgi:uncharacterized protein YdeI (YjbR/CyaY-like superfamily)